MQWGGELLSLFEFKDISILTKLHLQAIVTMAVCSSHPRQNFSRYIDIQIEVLFPPWHRVLLLLVEVSRAFQPSSIRIRTT